MEDVGVWQETEERAPLSRLAAEEAAAAVERQVRLGVEHVALENHQPCVDAATPERLHVRPRHAGGIDRAMDDAEAAALLCGRPATLRHRGTLPALRSAQTVAVS